MLLYYHTEKSLGDNYLLQEPLGPSLGIQAQLPVLLAEYAFMKIKISPIISTFSPPSGLTFKVS